MKRHSIVSLAQVVLGATLVTLVVYSVLAWMAAERTAHLPKGHVNLRPPSDVYCLALVDGAIWAGGKEGLFVFARDASALPVPADLRQLHFVSALLAEADGGVWLAHEDGMTHWTRTATRHYSTLATAFVGRGLSVLRDRDGVLWAGSDRHLLRLQGDAFRPVAIPEAFGLTEAAVLYQDRAGLLWIGDASPRSPGLISYGPQGFRLYTQQDGLPHHSINTLMQTRTGTGLWVGTGFAGAGSAVYIDQNGWRRAGRPQGLAGDKVRSIFEDSMGRLWFGSEYEGLAVFGAARLAIIGVANGLAGPEVKAILEYPPHTFWLGSNGGLTRIENFDAQQGDPRYPGFGGSAK